MSFTAFILLFHYFCLVTFSVRVFRSCGPYTLKHTLVPFRPYFLSVRLCLFKVQPQRGNNDSTTRERILSSFSLLGVFGLGQREKTGFVWTLLMVYIGMYRLALLACLLAGRRQGIKLRKHVRYSFHFLSAISLSSGLTFVSLAISSLRVLLHLSRREYCAPRNRRNGETKEKGRKARMYVQWRATNACTTINV